LVPELAVPVFLLLTKPVPLSFLHLLLVLHAPLGIVFADVWTLGSDLGLLG